MPNSSGGMGRVSRGPNPPPTHKGSYATKHHKTLDAMNPLGKKRKKKNVRKKRK